MTTAKTVKVPRRLWELIEAMVRVHVAAMNASDPDHEDFKDSGADVVQILWEGGNAEDAQTLLNSILIVGGNTELECGRCPNCDTSWGMHSTEELDECRFELGRIA
jgi:hypothetical protein